MFTAPTLKAVPIPGGAAAVRRRTTDGESRRRLVRHSLLGGVLLVLLLASPASADTFPGFSTMAGAVDSVVTNGPAAPSYTGPAGDTAGVPDSGTITLTSSRTVINFHSFDLRAEDTLNLVLPSANDTVLINVPNFAEINGTLNAYVGSEQGARGGNVWISAGGGLRFGPNSRVDVGGLLATTARIEDADFMQSGLGGANNDFNFHDADAPISILGGANIEGHGGVLAFIAPGVAQDPGAFVGAEPTADLATQADTEVLYGSARSYDLVFADGGRNLLSFDIPVGAATGGDVSLSGTTRAGEVFVASLLGHPGPGGSVAVGGIVTTQAAGLGGDVVVSAGGGVTRATALEPMRPVPHVGAPVQNVYLHSVQAAGAVRVRATGAIVRVGGLVWAEEDVTLVAGGDLFLNMGGVRGRTVALSTDAAFINAEGPDAVTASDHWVVYAAGLAGNDYGDLDSHNTALWGADIESRPPETIAGNRYVFAHSPTLTFTSLDLTKNFGEDATGALTYSVSGYHPGEPGAFRGDDATTAYSGTPALTSAGAPPAAPVEGSPYPIEISRGSLTSAAGYDIAFDSAGRLTVRESPRSLPMVVSGSTNWLLRDSLSGGSPTDVFSYGARPLVPIMGDWDGNGSRTPGTFEAGEFKLRNANSAGQPDITFRFGDPRGYPVAGDWNGDGRDDVAVYRNGTWEFRYADGDVPAFATRRFGSGNWPSTVPVAGDWDGDGTDTIGTYAYATGTWTLTNTEPLGDGPATAPFVFWQGSGSYPVVGDWDGDGTDTVGVKKATTWSLNDANDDSGPDVTFDFGGPNDLPLSWRR